MKTVEVAIWGGILAALLWIGFELRTMNRRGLNVDASGDVRAHVSGSMDAKVIGGRYTDPPVKMEISK